MAGTLAGGRKAAATTKARHGDDFFNRIAAIGGSKGKADGAVKGFAANPELAKIAGSKGGSRSKRKKVTA